MDDFGISWTLRVDESSITDFGRGWTTDGVESLDPLPRGISPRVAVGVESSGRIHTVRIASLVAPIWTGESTQFQLEGSDGLFHSCEVLELRAEHRRSPQNFDIPPTGQRTS